MVDNDDKVICVATRADIAKHGCWRRAVHIFLFRADNRLLLCKRPESRRAYPGLWTSSAGGHVECNEGYAAAAARELREELGIDCLLTDIGRFNVIDEHGKLIHHLFTGRWDQAVRSVGAECSKLEWFRLEEIKHLTTKEPHLYAEPFKRALEFYLDKL
jgi:isopentenyldiphosphate isomerase